MSVREEVSHEGVLDVNLDIPLGKGIMTLPAGTRLRVSTIVHEGEPEEGAHGLLYKPPDTVIEYHVMLVANGIRLRMHQQIRKSDG